MMRPCHKYVEFDAATFTRDDDIYVQTAYAWRFVTMLNHKGAFQQELIAWNDTNAAMGRKFSESMPLPLLDNVYPEATSEPNEFSPPSCLHRGKYPDLMAYDLAQMTANMAAFKRELLEVVMHPRHVARLPHLGLV
jgi:hypothetical protein